jgi:hypothetical protein
VGQPINQGPTSFFVDAFIWLIFGSFTMMTGLLPILIIPLSWTIYHIAVYKITKCPKCESLDMVSLHSRKGETAKRIFKDKQS